MAGDLRGPKDEWMNGSSKSLIAGTVCGKYAGSISGTWRYFHDVINDINFNNCSDFHCQTSRRMADAVWRIALVRHRHRLVNRLKYYQHFYLGHLFYLASSQIASAT